jgi:hypothetical protein
VRLQGGDISSLYSFSKINLKPTFSPDADTGYTVQLTSLIHLLTIIRGFTPKSQILRNIFNKKKEKMNGVRRDHGISLEAVMKDNHLTERKTKVTIF